MSAMAQNTGNCAGCGKGLAANRAPGRKRKWCSDRCRKAQYAGVCVDCGGPTDGGSGHPHAPLRCLSCAESRPHTVEIAREVASRQNAQNLWTDAQLLAALREADRAGIRSVPQWNASPSPSRPSAPTILSRFDTWNRARELAGLSVRRGRRAGYPRTTAQDCARAVATVWDALGSVPSLAVYTGYRQIERPDLPSPALIRIRCGSWLTALEMAQALVREPVAA